MFELADQISVATSMKIINVMGASVDGRIASSTDESDSDRERYGFTNPADRNHLDAMLAEADAVIVGGHSVNVSGGVMPAARQAGGFPTWVLMTNHGFEASAPVWQHSEVPKWIASGAPLPNAMTSGASRTIHAADDLPEAIAEACAAAGFERVLLFGGGRVNRQFYRAGLVDELVLTVCPVIVGRESGVPIVAPEFEAPVLLDFQAVRSEAGMVFIHYLVKR
jgi:5-amino-6-(5-phosphoribosylamino)uracil reductase